MERTGDERAPLPIGERDTVHWALNELAIKVVEAMLKELGVSKALELVRPRCRYSGRVMARNFASRFGLDCKGLEAIAFAPFCARCLTWGGKGRLTFYERGAINEFVTCPASHGPPEFCIMISHYVGEGICEEINPDFECLYTHHMTQGDPSCIGVCKRKDEPGIDSNSLGMKLREIESLEIDTRERDALSFNVEVHCVNIFLECFLSIISADRMSQLLGPTFKALGEEAGRKLMAETEVDSATVPNSILLTIGEMLGQECKVEEARKGEWELSVIGCIHCHSHLTVCELMESFLASMISTVCPGASIRFIRCKDASHEACRMILQRKRSKDEHVDPVVTLKMRFAKGEISEEDYRRIRSILLEDGSK